MLVKLSLATVSFTRLIYQTKPPSPSFLGPGELLTQFTEPIFKLVRLLQFGARHSVSALIIKNGSMDVIQQLSDAVPVFLVSSVSAGVGLRVDLTPRYGSFREVKATTAIRGEVTTKLPNLKSLLPMEDVVAFCMRWNIARLEVFGSALRNDFRADSDLDLLATYHPEARWSLLDRARMKLELEALLGRRVDLLNRRALEKTKRLPRNAAILAQAQPLYDRP